MQLTANNINTAKMILFKINLFIDPPLVDLFVERLITPLLSSRIHILVAIKKLLSSQREHSRLCKRNCSGLSIPFKTAAKLQTA
jgi:hypothetical protein